MNLRILGTGCVKCNRLEDATRTAVANLGLTVEIEKVTDPGEIAAWGVMSTPALVIDDDVVMVGRVPTPAEVEQLLSSR
jgi:small redox-active disulfide protein 2